jgi:hypothetical protein
VKAKEVDHEHEPLLPLAATSLMEAGAVSTNAPLPAGPVSRISPVAAAVAVRSSLIRPLA